ncbi:MAG: DegV family protein [Evtepia gabavorous]
MSFAIVTDSLAGLPLAQIARRGLVVIPLSYTISGKEHLCLAPEGYDSAAFFQTMKLRGEVSTSMVPPHRFLTFLKPLLRSGLDLLFLSASSGLSSSYQSACMAAEQLREEFPQRKLQIVDSLSSSLGQGLLVLRAFDLRERGMCLEDTARTLLSLRHRIAHLFTVDDLMYLSRGGRLSGAKAMLGTALGLKPLLKETQTPHCPVRQSPRRAQADGKLADQYNAWSGTPGPDGVHRPRQCPQEAEALAQRLRQTNPPKEILIAPFDPANGCHAGPGALALFFEGDETVRLHP